MKYVKLLLKWLEHKEAIKWEIMQFISILIYSTAGPQNAELLAVIYFPWLL
jgi:hypothetical protein